MCFLFSDAKEKKIKRDLFLTSVAHEKRGISKGREGIDEKGKKLFDLIRSSVCEISHRLLLLLLFFFASPLLIFIYSFSLIEVNLCKGISWIKRKHFYLYVVARLMFARLRVCVRAWMLLDVTKIVIRCHYPGLYNILIVHYYWAPDNSSSVYYVVVVCLAAAWVRLWANDDHNPNSFEKDFIN